MENEHVNLKRKKFNKKKIQYRFLLIVAVLCAGFSSSGYGETKTEKQASKNYTLPEITVRGERESMHAPEAQGSALIAVDPVELPLTVEILPEELIEDRNTSSFYETLQYVSGVFTGGNSSFTNTSGRPAIRGFTGNDVMLDDLVLPNRMPIFLDSEGIGGIEFNKGPMSSARGGQSGQQGSGGVVNILSKMPDFSKTVQQASIEGRFGNGSSERITYDPNFALTDELAIRLPLSYTNQKPFYLPDNLDSGNNFFISPALKWRLTSGTTASLSLSYQKSNKPAYQGIPYLKGSFLVPLDTYYGNKDTRDDYKGATALVKVEHAFSDRVNLSLGIGYAKADEDRSHWSVSAGAPRGRPTLTTLQYYDMIIATRTATYSYTSGDSSDKNMNAFARLNYDLKLSEVRNQLTFGADWLQRKTCNASVSGTTGWMSLDNPALVIPTLSAPSPMDTKVTRYGMTLQDFITWGQWRILAGSRLDKHESNTGTKADALSPRLGITYLIQPAFTAYANYTLATGPNFGMNDINKHELTDKWKSEQLEFGLKKSFFENLWATAGIFQITQKNTPVADPNDPTGMSFYSSGEYRSRGMEMSLNGELNDNWNWWGSYTNLKYEDVYNHIDFTRYPRNSFTLWTSYEIPSSVLQGLKAGAGYRYASKYCTTFRGAFISNDYMINGYSVVDIDLEYPLKWLSGKKAGTKFELGAKNVFDKAYVESNRHGTENFPGLPRTFWARLSSSF
jgi:iron complex outermembrane recepter protein